MLKVGDIAPDFTAPSSDGRTLTLSELRGRAVVLYFYPKAFTAGCTVETKGFRDNYEEFKALGAEVIGVSTDPFETQCEFADKHGVTFPLVGDFDKKISESYGVLRRFTSLDRRVTFLIDERGVIEAVLDHEILVTRHLSDVRRLLENRRAKSDLRDQSPAGSN
jgi:thioredoxin-dependent peroxiredoxin